MKGLLSNWLPFKQSSLSAFRPPTPATSASGTPPRSPRTSPSPSPSPTPDANKWLLKARSLADSGKKTLVLDLDETLVHSSFRPVENADYVLEVELEGEKQTVYVVKRPGLDQFLEALKDLDFEVVIFTASVADYADKVIDEIDELNVVGARLYRESCGTLSSGYVKDLRRLGRDLREVVIIDNSPVSYTLQPRNAIPIGTFIDDPRDNELAALLPLLNELAKCSDVTETLRRMLPSSKPTPPPSPLGFM